MLRLTLNSWLHQLVRTHPSFAQATGSSFPVNSGYEMEVSLQVE